MPLVVLKSLLEEPRRLKIEPAASIAVIAVLLDFGRIQGWEVAADPG